MHQITVNGQLLDSKSGSFTENGRTVNYHNFRVFDSDTKCIFKANNPKNVPLPEPMIPCVFVFDVNAGEKYTKLELFSCKPSLAPKA